MKKILSITMCMLLSAMILSGCEKKTDSAADTSQQSTTTTVAESSEAGNETTDTAVYQPVTIENMGRTTTYESAPEKVVVLSYSIAEIMAALDLQDKIVALAPSMYNLSEVLPEYQIKLEDIPVLEGNYGVPSFETVLNSSPDFVFGDSYSFMERNCGAVEDYDSNSIKIYATEGTYTENSTIENTYNDILNIGKIFGISPRAEALVAELKQREADVINKIEDENPVRVFAYDDGGSDNPATNGGAGLQNYIIEAAGGENIFKDLNTEFASVSWEELIERNPDTIIVYNYYTEDDAANKIEFLKNKPELADVNAIKNNSFIIVSGLSVFPSIQNINAIETIAAGLFPEE